MEPIYKNIKLNAAQTQAVEYTEGALLVVAGPGTGKTQLLSSRVAYILKNTDARAENILCLTFTNKAALNMRQRIIDITGGEGRNVYVRTFHSFAAEIMNMYPDYFWNNARLSSAPDAVQQEIIETILFRLPLDNPLAMKFAGKFTAVSDVKQSLKLTKEAGLTPEKLRALINSNLAYIDTVEENMANLTADRLSFKLLGSLAEKISELPKQSIDELTAPLISLSTSIHESLDHAIALDLETGKTTNAGKWKSQWIQNVNGKRGMHKERGKNIWWLHLADVYQTYRNELHARGYYDYSDMLVEVLTQIEKHPEMRADIQEKFLYVMIDEFQDTNEAQMRLAHLVADHHTAENNPNIMAVGDDDQSIFKFNGAELNNLLAFRRSYAKSKTIVLTENFRSTQSVLDTAGKVIALANDRLVHRDKSIDKKLIAKSNQKPGTIDHFSYRTVQEQLSAIAQEVKKAYSPNISIAVLARGHQSLRSIASSLISLDVPLHYEQQQNILEHPIIEQVALLAKISYGINIGDINVVNSNLAQSLRHPMWGIEPKKLWELALDNYHDPDWLNSLQKDEQLSHYAEFIFELSQVTSHENLNVSIEYLLGLRETVSGISPISKFYSDRENKDLSVYLHGLSAMQFIRNLANEYSVKSEANIENFVSFIDLEMSNGTVITDESPFVSGDHAVSLLTVHKAKGLEFDKVYILDAVEKNWQPRMGGRKAPTNLPLQPNGDDMDDYARLMYVALTRAKSDITVSSYRFDEMNKEVLASPLISSVIKAKEIDSKIDDIKILEQTLAWPRLNRSDERSLLKNRLADYSLSVTHLLNFLDVSSGGPEMFLEKNVLRLPQAKSSSLAHGTATHAALELAQKLVNSDSFDLNKVKEAYVSALQKEHLSFHETQRYISHGQQLIDKIFNSGLLSLTKGSAPEQNIKDVQIGPARLSGKLDRIDEIENNLIVSDYKTGIPLTSFATKNKNLEIKAWKQRTQLIYYSLLLQNSTRFSTKGKSITGQMIYLDAENSDDFTKSYSPSPEETERLSRLVQAVWSKIINVDLPDITKYSEDYAGILAFEEDLLKQHS